MELDSFGLQGCLGGGNGSQIGQEIKISQCCQGTAGKGGLNEAAPIEWMLHTKCFRGGTSRVDTYSYGVSASNFSTLSDKSSTA
jgi:hypothetical protein